MPCLGVVFLLNSDNQWLVGLMTDGWQKLVDLMRYRIMDYQLIPLPFPIHAAITPSVQEARIADLSKPCFPSWENQIRRWLWGWPGQREYPGSSCSRKSSIEGWTGWLGGEGHLRERPACHKAQHVLWLVNEQWVTEVQGGQTWAPSLSVEGLSWLDDSCEGEEHTGWTKCLEESQVGAPRFPALETSRRLLWRSGEVLGGEVTRFSPSLIGRMEWVVSPCGLCSPRCGVEAQGWGTASHLQPWPRSFRPMKQQSPSWWGGTSHNHWVLDGQGEG